MCCSWEQSRYTSQPSLERSSSSQDWNILIFIKIKYFANDPIIKIHIWRQRQIKKELSVICQSGSVQIQTKATQHSWSARSESSEIILKLSEIIPTISSSILNAPPAYLIKILAPRGLWETILEVTRRQVAARRTDRLHMSTVSESRHWRNLSMHLLDNITTFSSCSSCLTRLIIQLWRVSSCWHWTMAGTWGNESY